MKPNHLDTNQMNISLQYRGLNPRPKWQRLIESQVKKLQHLAAIASARVTLEQERQGKRMFRLFAILEVPGPDFHAEATDYTVQAALLKVLQNLRRQIQSRKERQLERRRAGTGRSSPLAFVAR